MSHISERLIDFALSEENKNATLDRYIDLVQDAGFSRYIIAALRPAGGSREPEVIATEWPEEWMRHYIESGYYAADPIQIWSNTVDKAFTWSEARASIDENPISRRLAADSRDAGLVDGVAFPVTGAGPAGSVVSLAADRPVDLSPREMAALHLATVSLLNRLLPAAGPAEPARQLSARERDVLRLVAMGQSYAEAALLLDISPGTVRIHLANIRSKLRVANTTHAVYEALRTGQIHLL